MVQFQPGARDFFSSPKQTDPGAHTSCCSIDICVISGGFSWAKHNHSSPSCVEVMDEWCCNSAAPCIPLWCRQIQFYFFTSLLLFKQLCWLPNSFYLSHVVFKYNQQDAMLYNILYYCQCSTCLRRFLRPSSGAQNCTHSIWYMSSFLAATASGSSKQAWHMLCVQFWAPHGNFNGHGRNMRQRHLTTLATELIALLPQSDQ
jgi:hypothetical protein